MKEKLSVCVSTQTPYVRFKLGIESLYDKYGIIPEPISLDLLAEGEDFDYTPGGVTKLLSSLLKSMHKKGMIETPHWISLNPFGPREFVHGSLVFHQVGMGHRELNSYGRFKEAIWKNLHGVEQTPIPREFFSGYASFNWTIAKRMLDLHSENEFDLFYLHDFQLLMAGSMLGPIGPKILRWHIPIRAEEMLPEWRSFLLQYLRRYDAVIVSCKEHKKILSKMGHRGKVYQVYPHLDPKEYKEPPRRNVNLFCEELGIEDDDQVLLVVGRLDPIKGQDIAIKALAHIARRYPNLKLVLVGDGSFSSSKRGGLGLPKGARWKIILDKLAESAGVEDRVIFTGYLDQEALRMIYTRADVVVVPSVLEGFGIVALEGWAYKKPVIISSGAGVVELAEDGKNSYVFNPSRPRELAEKIHKILSNPEGAEEIAERGYETLEQCWVKNVAEQIWDIFKRASEG